MNNLTIGELANLVGGKLQLGSLPPLGGVSEPVRRIVVSDAEAKTGDVFWGLQRPQYDGRMFAEQAFSQGALGAVVSGRQLEPWAGAFGIEVSDSDWALWQLATWCRQRFQGRVAAVAGVTERTTTHRMIAAVLGKHLTGAWQNRHEDARVSASLAMVDTAPNEHFSLVEINARQRSEMHAISGMLRPEVAVITSMHQESSRDEESLYPEIGVCNGLADDGWAVLPGDDPEARLFAETLHCFVMWVGRGAHNDVIAEHVVSGSGQLSFIVDGLTYTIPVWGRHYLTPALAAIATGRLFGLSDKDIASGLAAYRPPASACEVVRTAHWTIVNDGGASTPDAMAAAFRLLYDMQPQGRRVLVCSPPENRDSAIRWSRSVGASAVSACGADLLAVCGPNAVELVRAAQGAGMPRQNTMCCETPEEISELLKTRLAVGDVVLVKGDRCSGVSSVAETLRQASDPITAESTLREPENSP